MVFFLTHFSYFHRLTLSCIIISESFCEQLQGILCILVIIRHAYSILFLSTFFIPLSIHCITLTTKFFHQYWNNLIPVFTSILHEWYTNLLKIFPSQHNRNVCFHPSNPSSLYQLWPDKLIKDFTANDSNIFIRRFRIRPKTSMLILNIHPR